MALADLLRAVETDAEIERRRVVEAAAADAARIDAEAARDRADRLARGRAEIEIALRRASEGELAEAGRRARTSSLVARAAMLERIRTAVIARTAALVGDAGPALIAAALACAGDEGGVLRCAPVLDSLARAAAGPSLRVDTDAAVATGIVIELAGGTRIEATLEALFDRAWPHLACDAVNMAEAR